MKITNIFLIILIFTVGLSAQTDVKSYQNVENLFKKKTFSLNFGVGYATYDIDNFKSAFNNLKTQIDIPTKVTDNFPNVPFTSAEFLFNRGSFSFGGYFNSISTGGRIAYSDYSGSFKIDGIITSTTSGLLVNFIVQENDYANLCLDFRGGFSLLNLQLSENVTIGKDASNHTENSDLNYISYQFSLRLNFYYSMFEAGLISGYNGEIDNKSDVSFSGGRVILIVGLRI